MKNLNIISPDAIHKNKTRCCFYGGPKDCLGYLHANSLRVYDENGNELLGENIYSSKMYFKHVCDKCGHVVYLPYNLNIPNIIY